MAEPVTHFQSLIIGVGTYVYSRYFANLAVTIADAQKLGQLLTDPQRCGYPSDRVTLLTGEQATLANMRLGLQALAHPDSNDATTLVYFSGHGGHPIDQKFPVYLCPCDANPQDLLHTAMSSDEFSTLLAAIPTQRLLVILDTCYANGAASIKGTSDEPVWKSGLPGQYYQALTQGTGRVIIASSREDQSSYTYPAEKMSLFTYHLLEGLNGRAGIRGDGLIRVLDLFHYVSEAMRRTQTAQEPVLAVKDLGMNYPIALDIGGKKGVSIVAQSDVDAIRQLILSKPQKGAEALVRYLDKMPKVTLDGMGINFSGVELWLSDIQRIEDEIHLFGETTANRAALQQNIYKLLQTCSKLKQEQ